MTNAQGTKVTVTFKNNVDVSAGWFPDVTGIITGADIRGIFVKPLRSNKPPRLCDWRYIKSVETQ